ncbi:MAG TPA: MFS transporter [Gemmatimonadales bacterium]
MTSVKSGRILAASILGSGAVFLEGTVVNVALPAMGRDFHLGIDGLQWIVDAYLLTLGSLILLGGALGDRYPRIRVFKAGCFGFAMTSGLCAFAPTLQILALLRFAQGVTGALLVPNSLALLEESFHGEARGTAVGRWSAGSAASTAIGPLAGGLILGFASWRWIFALVAPAGLAAALILPTESGDDARRHGTAVDYPGAILVTAGLGALTVALIAGPRLGFGNVLVLGGIAAALVLLSAFFIVETRARHPLLDLSAFKSAAFVAANLTTLLVYGALGVILFLLMLVLQNELGYTALQAGSSLLPINALLFTLSSRAGKLAGRIGPRLPMAAGCMMAGIGLAMFGRVHAGGSYLADVLPAVIVFGLGLATLVAPLTSAALDSLGEKKAGLASGANNAVARLAGLIATAAVPLAAGIGGLQELHGVHLMAGFHRAMWICAALCIAGGAVSFAGMPNASGRASARG